MSKIFDLLFDQSIGDCPVVDGDLLLVSDNEAIQQAAKLGTSLQIGFNQYSASAGWDWMRYGKANLTVSDITEICRQVKQLTERIDYVISAEVTYLGYFPVGSGQSEHVFDVKARTQFGTFSISSALGGFNVGA